MSINKTDVFDEGDLITSLPPQLQYDIQRHLGLGILFQIDFFKDIDPSVLGEISLRMRSISCNEEYDLFKVGDRAKHIYIQRTGKSILKYKKQKILLKRGSVCGENALICSKRKTTIKCQTWSEFYVLAVNDIVFVLQSEFPATWKVSFLFTLLIIYRFEFWHINSLICKLNRTEKISKHY